MAMLPVIVLFRVCVCVCVRLVPVVVCGGRTRRRVSGERGRKVEATKGGSSCGRCSALEGRCGPHPIFWAEAALNLWYMAMSRARCGRVVGCAVASKGVAGRGGTRERELGLVASRRSKGRSAPPLASRSLALEGSWQLAFKKAEALTIFTSPLPRPALGEAIWEAFGGTQTTQARALRWQSTARTHTCTLGMFWLSIKAGEERNKET